MRQKLITGTIAPLVAMGVAGGCGLVVGAGMLFEGGAFILLTVTPSLHAVARRTQLAQANPRKTFCLMRGMSLLSRET